MQERDHMTAGRFGGVTAIWQMRIVKPDGVSVLHECSYAGGSVFLLEPVTLPEPGIYTIVIDPASYRTGSADINLYDVLPDATATVTVNALGPWNRHLLRSTSLERREARC
jgi:hypothetical protein